ncbi:MAG: SRPBCC family protein [Pseudomonadota bacterium]
MRILKWLIGLVVVAAVAFVAVGFMLPREVNVARSIDIDAPAKAVFVSLNSPKATTVWSPWMAKDPQQTVTFDGPESGVGAKMAWQSDNPSVGTGSSEITESTPFERIGVALDFGEMGTANAAYDLAETDGTTSVTWSFETDMGEGLVGRWMGLMMDRWVGADFEAGLANLKQLVEDGGAQG